jgi:hypothetical protein
MPSEQPKEKPLSQAMGNKLQALIKKAMKDKIAVK